MTLSAWTIYDKSLPKFEEGILKTEPSLLNDLCYGIFPLLNLSSVMGTAYLEYCYRAKQNYSKHMWH